MTDRSVNDREANALPHPKATSPGALRAWFTLPVGEADELHERLAGGRVVSAGLVNVWFDACHLAGDVDAYLRDVDVAHSLAENDTDAALRDSRPAAAFGLEIRYALMKAWATHAGQQVDDECAVLLAETGVWSADRALANARRHPYPEERCRAVVALLPHVPGERRTAVARGALEDAVENCFNGVRGGGRDPLVDELAPLVGQTDWSHALKRVEEGIRDQLGGDALTPIIPHLPDDLLERAVAVTAALPPNIFRSSAMEQLAPRLTPQLATEALAAAREIDEAKYLADALIALLPQLPPDLASDVRRDAVAAVSAIDPPIYYDDPVRRWRWTSLIPLLPGDERPPAIMKAVAGEPDAEGHADLLVDLATQLPEPERPTVTTDALRVAHTIDDAFARAQVLIAIAELEPHVALAEARHVARTITDPLEQAQALTEILDQVAATERDAVLDEALDAARRIVDPDDRAFQLSELAMRADLARQASLASESADTARAVADDDRRFDLLLDAADLLSGPERHAVLEEALAIRWDDVSAENYFNGPVLDALAPRLDEDLMTRVLLEVRDTGRLGYLARVLHRRAAHLTGSTLDVALELAHTITGRGRAHQRAAVLTALSDQLPDERRPAVLEAALAAAREAGSDVYRIARRLPHPESTALLIEQLTPARIQFDESAAIPPFDAVPIRKGSAAYEYLVRAQRAHRHGASPTAVIGLLREALSRIKLNSSTDLRALAAAARDLGGPEALNHCLTAAYALQHWLPPTDRPI